MEETNIEKLGFNEPHQYTLEELIAIKEKQDKVVAEHKVIDEFTGQECRCRSSLNNKGFIKLEVNTKESETDDSLYEPIDDLIKRCQRAGLIRDYRAAQALFNQGGDLDFDADFDNTQLSTYDIIDATDDLNKLKQQIIQKAGATKSGDDKEQGTSDAKEPDQGATA